MINQTKTNRGSSMKYLVSIPLVIVMFLLFSFKDLEKSVPQKLLTADQSDPGAYTTVDQLPEFEGGMEGLVKYLGSNLKYPSEAVKKKVEGTTYVSFIVNEDGTMADTKITKGFNADCDAEVLRVVKATSGKWVPGKNKGKTVKVSYILPIKFKI